MFAVSNEHTTYLVMANIVKIITVRSLLCSTLLASFLVFSDAFQWVNRPAAIAHKQTGLNLTLMWHYRLSNSETFDGSTIEFGDVLIAKRKSINNPYMVSPKYKDIYVVLGKGNITFIILSVSAKDDGKYCFTVNYDTTVAFQKEKNCSTLDIFSYPKINYKSFSKNITANVSQTVEMYCNATSKPKPKIKWYKSSDPLNVLSKSNSLRISVNSSKDHGEYVCNATNPYGWNKEHFLLNVQYKPKITEYRQERFNISEGKDATLTCTAIGNPAPTITWSFKGKELDQARIIQLTSIGRNQSGEYICTARNMLGMDSKTIQVDVLYKPRIAFHQSSKSVDEKENITLYCNATGNPSPLVQWFNKSSAIHSGVGEVNLPFIAIGWQDAGDYNCTATNSEGADSRKTTLIVQYKPRIIKDHPIINATEEESVTLMCQSKGYPPPEVKWTRENKTISNNSIHVMPSVNRADAGYYKCIATNIMGMDEYTIELVIFYEPDIIKTKDEETVKIGGNVNMSCSAKGKPIPDVQWFRGDLKVSPVGVGMATLLLGNVNRTNAGNYICRASNLLGNAEKTSTLIVLHPPVQTNLTTETGSNSVVVNQKLILHCLTIAIPSPTWYIFEHNGANLTNSANNTYTIDRVSLSDEGTYSCTPGNLLGVGESSSLNITVLVPPILDEKPSNLTVTLSGTITLKCIASGKPSAKITWTKDNSPRVIHTGEIFNKTNVKRCDVGVYRCTAKNNVGRPVSAQAFVAVNSLPEIPRILKFDQSEDGVEIHWEQPTINCSLAITGYIARVRKKDSQSEWIECPAKKSTGKMWTCSVGDLESNTLYNVQIIAKNRVGQGEPAKGSFKTDVGADASGTSGKSKGGRLKQTYIIIGACAGVLILLLIVLIVYRKCGKKDGASLLAPIELNPANGPSQSNAYQVQNAHDGPMSASQETLEVNEIQVNGTEEKGKDVNGIEGGQSKEKDGIFEWTLKPKINSELIYGLGASLQWNYTIPNSEDFNFIIISKYQKAKSSYRRNIAMKMANGRVVIYSDFKSHVDLIDAATLRIDNVDMNDEGIYCCEVHYSVKSAINCMQAFVLVLPKITHHPRNKTILEGSDVSLYCNATGIPVPSMEWYRMGSPHHRLSTGTTLRLPMTRNNSGAYVCKALNRIGAANATAYIDVLYPPEAKVSSKSNIANQSDVVKIECHVNGNPLPSIEWTKMGRHTEILSIKSILTINITGKSDEGMFRCEAKNGIGSASFDIATVFVRHHAPFNSTFETCPLNNQVIEKQTFIMQCSAIASPSATFFIYQNQKLIKENRSGYHKICRVKKNHTGNYTCVPVNRFGFGKSVTIQLEVQYSPKVVTTPKTIQTKEGEVVILECVVTGNPSPNIIWEREGVSGILSTESILVFNETRRSDKGNYTCRAYNGIGTSVVSSSYLDVYYPPEILIHPLNKKIKETFNTSFYCEAVGNPEPKITWTKSDHSIMSSINGSEEKLNFINVSRMSAGIYVCTASNALGNVSVTTELDVQYKPSKTKLLSSAPQNTVTMKDSVTLYCVTDANPKADVYQFFYDGDLIAITNNGAHHLLSVEKANEGVYECKAANVFGEGNTVQMFLRVEVPPTVAIRPESQILNEGDILIMTCESNGDPLPNITWTMSNSTKVISNEPLLTIRNITRLNEGLYICIASNGVGENDIALSKVYVNYKPNIISSRTSYQQKGDGNMIQLTCSAKGYPIPAIVWSPLPQNSTVLTKVVSKTMTVSSLTFKAKNRMHDVQAIQCFAWNVMGNDLANVTISSDADKMYSRKAQGNTNRWFGLPPLVVLGIMAGLLIVLTVAVVMASIYRQHTSGKVVFSR